MKKLGLGALLSLSVALSAQSKQPNTVVKITVGGKTKTIKADGKRVEITIVQDGDTTVLKGTHIVKSSFWNDSLSAHIKKELYRLHDLVNARDLMEGMKAAFDFDKGFHWGKKSPLGDSTASDWDAYLSDKERRDIKLYEYSKNNPAFSDFKVKKHSDLKFESLHYSTTSRGFKISFKTKPKPTCITLESAKGEKLYHEKNPDFEGRFDRDFAFTAAQKGHYLFRVTQGDQSWVLAIDVQ